MLHSLVNKVNFKINVWNLKDLKKHSFNCISHFVTGKEGIVPINPQFRLAKIAGNILKTAGMVGFNDSFFLCRTFSLIQRLLASNIGHCFILFSRFPARDFKIKILRTINLAADVRHCFWSSHSEPWGILIV